MKTNPKIGQFVYDPYEKRKRKVKGIGNGLYYIGSDHEPMHRHEFFFPLPALVERQYISIDSKQY